jgi:hypothetical protein
MQLGIDRYFSFATFAGNMKKRFYLILKALL